MFAAFSAPTTTLSGRTPVRAGSQRQQRRRAVVANGNHAVTTETTDDVHTSLEMEMAGGDVGRRGALKKIVGGALFAAAGFAGPATANVKYANDCDPICHILDDGAAKSKKMESEMKSGAPDMGSAMEKLLAERKAEEKAAVLAALAAAGGGKGDAKPRGF